MHEFVLSGRGSAQARVKTLDVAKRLLEFGVARADRCTSR
jgi:glycine cleavage system protein P-like pyridoxal-binding family